MTLTLTFYVGKVWCFLFWHSVNKRVIYEKSTKMISEFAKEKVFWTRKMNLKLVKFIESRPNIWNPKHPKYTSAEFKDQTYNEFAAKYGNDFTGQAVKDRWTNIRSTFANYLRKLKASQAKGDGEEYKVNWHLWEACQFLLKVNKRVKTDASISENFFDALENGDSLPTSKDHQSTDEEFSDNGPNSDCVNIAESLLQVFRGVQNDAFGIDNTKHGKVGRIVAKALCQMDSYDAARASCKIMEVLQFYHESSPLNPNNVKSE